MPIKMHRVDFRMIHGQVAGVWIPFYSASKVVIIDDQTSKDNFVQQVLKFAAPKGTTVEFYNTENGVANYKKDQFGNGNTIVLFRSIEGAHKAFSIGYDFPSLNVGQTPRGEGMMHATASVFVTAQDMRDLVEMSDKGVEVYFRQDATKEQYTIDQIKNKLSGKY